MIIESVARGLCRVASWGKAVQSSGEGAMEVPGIAAFGKVGADGTIVLTPLASVAEASIARLEEPAIAQFAPDDDESQRARFIFCSPLRRTPS